MSITPINISTLIDWLGPEGAVSGLERSNITNAELMVIARERGLIVEKKTSRKLLAIELVMSERKRINKTIPFLMKMEEDELQRYFSDRMVSDKEIRSLLTELGIAPTGKIRGKISTYAAREIRELGMFERVAKGSKK